jgi:septal ring factor EnvC (AmiA/AmiB activator)
MSNLPESDTFSYAGKPWSSEEEQQLINEYTVQKYDIMMISKIHKRMPGGILSRLLRCNIIGDKRDARGYQLYSESPILKENKEKRLQQREDRLQQKQNQDHKKIEYLQMNQISIMREIKEVKSSISELKQNIQEIKAMLEAVYEFE